MKLRSPLFAPGDSERKAAKALASAADVVILDLEDSVAAGGKDAARAVVAALLPAIVRPGCGGSGEPARPPGTSPTLPPSWPAGRRR